MDEEEIFEKIVKYVEENSQVIKNLSEKTETLENDKYEELKGYIRRVDIACRDVVFLIIIGLLIFGHWKHNDMVKNFEDEIERIESRIEELEEIIEDTDENIELKDDYGSISYSNKEKGYVYRPGK